MQYLILGTLIILGLLFPKSKSVSAGLLFIVWILFAFNRGNADYNNYMIWYQTAQLGTSIFGVIEGGYNILMIFFRDYLNLSYEGFRLIFSSMALILMYASITHYTKNRAFVMALFSIFPLLISIVQMRNFFAFTIVFWGLRYLDQDNVAGILKYCACVLVATTIHTSCIFYFLAILSKLDAKKLIMAVAIWCATGSSLIFRIGAEFIEFSEKYTKYFSYRTSVLTQIFTLVFLGGIVVFSYVSAKYAKEYVAKQSQQGVSISDYVKRSCRFVDIIYKVSIIGFAAWPLIVLNGEFMRIPRYILLLSYTSFSMTVLNKRKTKMQYLFGAVLCVFATASMWFFEMYNSKLYTTVFLDCMENNEIFNCLFR